MKEPRSLWQRRINRRSLLKAGAGGLAGIGALRNTQLSARTPRRLRATQAVTSRAAAVQALTDQETRAGETSGHTLQQISGTAPLLVLLDAASDVFNSYLAEILRCEGVLGYETAPVGSLGPALLAGRAVVLLSPTTLSAAQINDLTAFVNAGGGLVAFQPSAGLGPLLGLSSAGGSTSEGYVRITHGELGAGLYNDTMQFHGQSSHYTLTGATEVAALYSTRTASTGRPAASIFDVGAGRAAMLSYNLARSVVLTRQGNPANANVDVDGDGIFRAIDLYNGWVDLQRSHVPQADIQQRLLVRLLEAVAPQPTPRLWYFPGASPTVLVATGDAHANPESYYQDMIDDFTPRGVDITFYITTSGPSPAALAGWTAQGYDFAPHPYVDGGYQQGYAAYFNDFESDYGFTPRTARTHQVRWSGWTDAAGIESQVGVEMDFNTYQWGVWLNMPGGPARGYVCGSGLPMRYMTANGNLLPIYQQHTNLVDEELAGEVGVAGLTAQQGLEISRLTIDESVGGFHTAIVTQYHVDYYGWGGVNPWVLGTTDYALQQGATPLHADDWLSFVKGRFASGLSNAAWSANTLSFELAPGGGNLTLLLPASFRGAPLSQVKLNGSPVGFSTMTINNRGYAAIAAVSGGFAVSYQADSVPPEISAVSAAPATNGAVITWTTNEPADSLVRYGVGANLNQQAADTTLTLSHSIQLSGLQPSTSYSYQVISADASDNSSQSATLSFQTTAPGAPTLQSVSPANSPQGVAQLVTLTGANFIAGATARLDTTPLNSVTVVSATSIEGTVPPTLPAGVYDVTVQNPDGQSATLPNAYTIIAPAPLLQSISPATVTPGQQITLTGQHFLSGAVVTIDGLAAASTVLDPTSATASVPGELTPGVYDVTLTNPDSQSSTLPDALTVGALPTIGHTTLADFAAGTFTTTAAVSGGDAGDGAVALASNGWLDTFDAPPLSPARWTSGLWQQDGSVGVANGELLINGAWARSLATITAGLVTARLTLTSSAWLNVGLSRDDALDNPWFLFGVPGWDTSQVYARVNYGATVANYPLPGLLGQPHDYAISYGQGLVRFLVDGQVVQELNTGIVLPLAVWLSSGATASVLRADSVSVASYPSNGTFLGAPLDAGSMAGWRQLLVSSNLPTGTSLSARARSSLDAVAWSAWSPAISAFPAELTIPDGRYLQYDLQLATTSASSTPLATSVYAAYQSFSGPLVATIAVSPASATLEFGGQQQFTAQAFDGTGQPVTGAAFTWSVVNGGGTITSGGLFTAGSTAGEFAGTVIAASQGVTGAASVTVLAPPPPQVDSVSPSVAVAGQTITVAGANFKPGAAVRLDSVAVTPVNVASATSLSFSAPDLPAGVYDVTVQNPAGGSGTLPNGLTITSLQSVEHTTAADFQAGTLTSTSVAQGGSFGDGAVTLLSSGWTDEFDGTALDPARWTSGQWQPDGVNALAGGALSLSGAWVRSVTGAGSGAVTARLTFSGDAWANFGLSRGDALDNPWFLFGVPGWDTSRVYARSNFGSTVADQPLGGLIGTPHNYTIEYTPSAVRFLVDGALVHEVAITAQGALHIWLSVGPTASSLTVESAGYVNYAPSGSFLSATLDAGSQADWVEAILTTTAPQQTSFSARFRSSADASAWSAWTPAHTTFPQLLALPDGQYLQYELQLASTNAGASPVINSVAATFHPALPPVPATVGITPSDVTLAPGATQQFSATAQDANGATLPGATFAWSVANGGGTITQTGLFTAGTVNGSYPATVVATSNGVSGSASVTVAPTPPQITSVTPNIAIAGDLVTIDGAEFDAGLTVRLDTTTVTPVEFVSAQRLRITAPDLPSGVYDVTVENPDGGTTTLVDGLTIATLASVEQTTVAEFEAGTLTETSVASGGSFGDGAVTLRSAGWLDEFTGSALDASRWASGGWLPGNILSLAGSILTLAGSWARSQNTFTSGSVTARMTFTGDPWVNVGLSRGDALDNPWFLFGVPGWDTSRVYARSNFGSTVADQPLDGLIGAPHDFTIVYGPGLVSFLVDGLLAHEVVTTPTNTGALAIWLSAGPLDSVLDVESVRFSQYVASGSFLSAAMDAGSHVTWTEALLGAGLPNGTALAARFRSSPNGTAWSTWSATAAAATQPLALPDGRYLQYELQLSSSNTGLTPQLNSLAATYRPAPASVLVDPAAVTLLPGSEQQFSATVLNAQGQPMPNATVIWSVVAGGGQINQSGLFTAGTEVGEFTGTVVATSGTATGVADVTIELGPPPAVTGVAPAVVEAGEQVNITGSNFDPSAIVNLNATPVAATVQSATSVTLTMPALPAGLYDVTVTNQDGQSATLAGALTMTVVETLTHTTMADFSVGTFTGTEAAGGGAAGDGAVQLASAGWADSFDGATLDAGRWKTGTWEAGGTSQTANGQLTVAGAWARSADPVNSVTVTARLAFTSSAWVNFGLSRNNDLNNPWFLFGVPGWDTSQVYVRWNFGSTVGDVPLPGLIGQPHDYTIQFQPGLVRFLVDGAQVYELQTTVNRTLAIWFSSGGIAALLAVDEVSVASYGAGGTFLDTFDAGSAVEWLTLDLAATGSPQTSVNARARTSPDGSSWSAWSPAGTGPTLALELPVGRYLQYELQLASSAATQTPTVASVSATYRRSS